MTVPSHRPWLRHYDTQVPTKLDLEPVTALDRFRRAVAQFGDRPAITLMNRTLTYAEVAEHVGRLATAFHEMGVTPGDRVAILSPNLPQFEIAYFAAQSVGAIPVPTNPLYTAREIEHQWNDAHCTVAVVMDYAYVQKVRAIRDKLPVRHYIVTSIPDYLRFPLNLLAPLKLKKQQPPLIAPIPNDAHVHAFREIVRRTPNTPPAHSATMDDVAVLLYTGGTTGVSKGAALTHANVSANTQQIVHWFWMAESGREVSLGALPLFHSFGHTVVMHMSIALGAHQVLIPNPRDIPAIIKAVVKHRISLFAAVPNHYRAINQFAASHRVDLSSIKACNSGSAPLPVDTLETFERLTGAVISEGFGLTETSPVTHCNPLHTLRKPGSIGVPLPGTDQRIMDPETGTRELATGEVGELVLRGPQIMRGYWQKPDATADMVRDGWLYTGDLARIDADGFCFIEGRKKDMILCSGYNVYPDEIDRVLAEHPAVLEAATIGVPDISRGETVKSFVVLRPGMSASADALMEHCRTALAPYKVPRALAFLPELPKSSVLKILRRELRDREIASRPQP